MYYFPVLAIFVALLSLGLTQSNNGFGTTRPSDTIRADDPFNFTLNQSSSLSDNITTPGPPPVTQALPQAPTEPDDIPQAPTEPDDIPQAPTEPDDIPQAPTEPDDIPEDTGDPGSFSGMNDTAPQDDILIPDEPEAPQ